MKASASNHIYMRVPVLKTGVGRIDLKGKLDKVAQLSEECSHN